jgi:hypothetical protein
MAWAWGWRTARASCAWLRNSRQLAMMISGTRLAEAGGGTAEGASGMALFLPEPGIARKDKVRSRPPQPIRPSPDTFHIRLLTSSRLRLILAHKE